jgi:hypothetical protein
LAATFAFSARLWSGREGGGALLGNLGPKPSAMVFS